MKKQKEARNRGPEVNRVPLEYETLQKQIICDAKGVGIPTGVAQAIAEKMSERVLNWIEKRGTITEADLYRQLAKEAKKYSADLVYVYENRDKII